MLLLAENFPELKANANFQQLMSELKDAEEKIRYSRQFYNDTVQKYNTKIEVFPSNIIANMFGFRQERFFEITESERQAPRVDFSGTYDGNFNQNDAYAQKAPKIEGGSDPRNLDDLKNGRNQ